MKNVVIFGASGHGSVVLDCIAKEGKYKPIGFLDSFKKKNTELNGYKILGNEFDLKFLKDKHQIFGGIVAIGDNWTRKLVVDKILSIVPDFNFISVVHPKTTIGIGVDIGKGTVVMPGVTINVNSTISDHCILNTNSSLDHDGFMGDYSSLAPNVCAGGNLILGEGSAVCLGSNIIENIAIGRHTVIGAGSLVIGNVESHVLSYGAPAKKIKNRVAGEPYLSGKRNTSLVIPFAVNEI